MLHFEPSSCPLSVERVLVSGALPDCLSYPSRAVMEGPDRLIGVYAVAEGVGECWAFRYRGYGRF